MPSRPVRPSAGRTGANRRSAIPPEVLAALNRGQEATRTLSEWLAVDQAAVARAVLPEVLGEQARPVIAVAESLAAEGVMGRTRGIGAALAPVLRADLGTLASHRSDVVRTWVCYAYAAQPRRTLAQRLADLRPFAVDEHFGVREIAWMALRPHLAVDLPQALTLLRAWAADADANLRRCASEATRPRGVWCTQLTALVADPAPAEPLLDLLRADPSRYVQVSVGNWLNDAGKSCPDWLDALAQRWRSTSPGTATAAILVRGLRNRPV